MIRTDPMMSDKWRGRILAYAESGLTVSQWCEDNSISRSAFYQWVRWLDMRDDVKRGIERAKANHADSTREADPDEGITFIEMPLVAGVSKDERDTQGAKFADGTTFIEMPQLAGASSDEQNTAESDDEAELVPRMKVRIGKYDLILYDGFREQDLASAVRVLTDA